jgi:hypothetical protein
MKQKKSLLLIALLISLISGWAQTRTTITEEDKKALEGIIVEKYYTATEADCKDTVGGVLPKGSVTYRIYVDMKPGYKLQAVYGVSKHEFFIKTTTSFFNYSNGGQSADEIFDSRLNQHNMALDSWITLNVCSKSCLGVLKTEDTDSSMIKNKPTLEKADGMTKGDTQKLLYYGIDLTPFKSGKFSEFRSGNGSWVSVGKGKGPTATNKVLIAQLTTDGKLSFELNLQLGSPDGHTVQFVAKDPTGDEVKSKCLTYKSK